MDPIDQQQFKDELDPLPRQGSHVGGARVSRVLPHGKTPLLQVSA